MSISRYNRIEKNNETENLLIYDCLLIISIYTLSMVPISIISTYFFCTVMHDTYYIIRTIILTMV